MPRKPSYQSILREIRKIHGWNQSELADRLGTTPITVSRIENGSLKISRRLALRLSWSTQVRFRDIMENKKGHPENWEGPLTRDNWNKLVQKAQNLSDQQLQLTLAAVSERASLVLRKALGSAPRKYWSLLAAIQEAFDNLETEFGLDKTKKIRPKRLQEQSAKTPALRVLSRGGGNIY